LAMVQLMTVTVPRSPFVRPPPKPPASLLATVLAIRVNTPCSLPTPVPLLRTTLLPRTVVVPALLMPPPRLSAMVHPLTSIGPWPFQVDVAGQVREGAGQVDGAGYPGREGDGVVAGQGVGVENRLPERPRPRVPEVRYHERRRRRPLLQRLQARPEGADRAPR